MALYPAVPTWRCANRNRFQVIGGHIQKTDPNGYFEGAPALAVEVASDSNTATQLDLKIEQYFAHGSDEVWVVYPKTRKVLVHLADGGIKTIAGSELRSDLFPGWQVQVDALFDV